MDMSFEDLVRERAYYLWLAGGMADGQADEHWVLAEQAVKVSEPVVILTKVAKKPVAKAAAKPAGKTVAKAAKSAPKSVTKSSAKKAAKAEMSATAH